jgi:hypothetical protein
LCHFLCKLTNRNLFVLVAFLVLYWDFAFFTYGGREILQLYFFYRCLIIERYPCVADVLMCTLWSVTDCFRRSQTSCFWDLTCRPSGWWGSCLQKDPFESWRCSRKECFDKLLGMIMEVVFFLHYYILILLTMY